MLNNARFLVKMSDISGANDKEPSVHDILSLQTSIVVKSIKIATTQLNAASSQLGVAADFRNLLERFCSAVKHAVEEGNALKAVFVGIRDEWISKGGGCWNAKGISQKSMGTYVIPALAWMQECLYLVVSEIASFNGLLAKRSPVSSGVNKLPAETILGDERKQRLTVEAFPLTELVLSLVSLLIFLAGNVVCATCEVDGRDGVCRDNSSSTPRDASEYCLIRSRVFDCVWGNTLAPVSKLLSISNLFQCDQSAGSSMMLAILQYLDVSARVAWPMQLSACCLRISRRIADLPEGKESNNLNSNDESSQMHLSISEKPSCCFTACLNAPVVRCCGLPSSAFLGIVIHDLLKILKRSCQTTAAAKHSCGRLTDGDSDVLIWIFRCLHSLATCFDSPKTKSSRRNVSESHAIWFLHTSKWCSYEYLSNENIKTRRMEALRFYPRIAATLFCCLSNGSVIERRRVMCAAALSLRRWIAVVFAHSPQLKTAKLNYIESVSLQSCLADLEKMVGGRLALKATDESAVLGNSADEILSTDILFPAQSSELNDSLPVQPGVEMFSETQSYKNYVCNSNGKMRTEKADAASTGTPFEAAENEALIETAKRLQVFLTQAALHQDELDFRLCRFFLAILWLKIVFSGYYSALVRKNINSQVTTSAIRIVVGSFADEVLLLREVASTWMLPKISEGKSSSTYDEILLNGGASLRNNIGEWAWRMMEASTLACERSTLVYYLHPKNSKLAYETNLWICDDLWLLPESDETQEWGKNVFEHHENIVEEAIRSAVSSSKTYTESCGFGLQATEHDFLYKLRYASGLFSFIRAMRQNKYFLKLDFDPGQGPELNEDEIAEAVLSLLAFRLPEGIISMHYCMRNKESTLKQLTHCKDALEQDILIPEVANEFEDEESLLHSNLKGLEFSDAAAPHNGCSATEIQNYEVKNGTQPTETADQSANPSEKAIESTFSYIGGDDIPKWMIEALAAACGKELVATGILRTVADLSSACNEKQRVALVLKILTHKGCNWGKYLPGNMVFESANGNTVPKPGFHYPDTKIGQSSNERCIEEEADLMTKLIDNDMSIYEEKYVQSLLRRCSALTGAAEILKNCFCSIKQGNGLERSRHERNGAFSAEENRVTSSLSGRDISCSITSVCLEKVMHFLCLPYVLNRQPEVLLSGSEVSYSRGKVKLHSRLKLDTQDIKNCNNNDLERAVMLYELTLLKCISTCVDVISIGSGSIGLEPYLPQLLLPLFLRLGNRSDFVKSSALICLQRLHNALECCKGSCIPVTCLLVHHGDLLMDSQTMVIPCSFNRRAVDHLDTLHLNNRATFPSESQRQLICGLDTESSQVSEHFDEECGVLLNAIVSFAPFSLISPLAGLISTVNEKCSEDQLMYQKFLLSGGNSWQSGLADDSALSRCSLDLYATPLWLLRAMASLSLLMLRQVAESRQNSFKLAKLKDRQDVVKWTDDDESSVWRAPLWGHTTSNSRSRLLKNYKYAMLLFSGEDDATEKPREFLQGAEGNYDNRDEARDANPLSSMPDIIPWKSRGKFGRLRYHATHILNESRKHLTDTRAAASAYAHITVARCLFVLSTRNRELLPRIHEVWPSLRISFDADAPLYVFLAAVAILRLLVSTSGGFIRERFLNCILPSFMDRLSKSEPTSKTCGQSRTDNLKTEVAILSTISYIANVQPSFLLANSAHNFMFALSFRSMHLEAPKALITLGEDILHACFRLNPCLTKLKSEAAITVARGLKNQQFGRFCGMAVERSLSTLIYKSDLQPWRSDGIRTGRASVNVPNIDAKEISYIRQKLSEPQVNAALGWIQICRNLNIEAVREITNLETTPKQIDASCIVDFIFDEAGKRLHEAVGS